MRLILRHKSFPGHQGIPGHQGGSLPKGQSSTSSSTARVTSKFKDHKALAKDVAAALGGTVVPLRGAEAKYKVEVRVPGGDASHSKVLDYLKSLGLAQYNDSMKTDYFRTTQQGTSHKNSAFTAYVTRGKDMSGKKITTVEIIDNAAGHINLDTRQD